MTFVFQTPEAGGGGGGNPISGTTTTGDDTPTPITDFGLGTAEGTWLFTFNSVAYDKTDKLGQGAVTHFSIRTTSTTVTLIQESQTDWFEDPALEPAGISFSFDQNPNILVISVTGLAGKTIDWSVIGNFLFVG